MNNYISHAPEAVILCLVIFSLAIVFKRKYVMYLIIIIFLKNYYFYFYKKLLSFQIYKFSVKRFSHCDSNFFFCYYLHCKYDKKLNPAKS